MDPLSGDSLAARSLDAGLGDRARLEAALGKSPRHVGIRHGWVLLGEQEGDFVPCLVLEWRQDGEGWQGRTVWAEPEGEEGWAIRSEWVPAARLRGHEGGPARRG